MTQTDLRPRGSRGAARCADQPALPLRVNGWELVQLAAEGCLARIFRARPSGTPADRSPGYAVKMLHPRWEDEPRAIRLLLREAIVGRSVSHPHLISILAANISRPPRFVVTPWLDGHTLRARLDAGRCDDLPTMLWIGRQVAEALGALGAAGWMHGDVTPSNIFLSPAGHVTLLDLGFARRPDEVSSVADRCVMGTCNYMAPEYITSALRPDIRSDIYSLGVVLFEQLSGRLPFLGKDLGEVAVQHKRARPPDLHRLAPQLPGEVVGLVHQMLAKDPLRRPQDPLDLVERLATLEIATFSERAW